MVMLKRTSDGLDNWEDDGEAEGPMSMLPELMDLPGLR